MIELTGNIWDQEAEWICVTTNGNIKSNGLAVMGRGIAKQASNRFPNLAKTLALQIESKGNIVSLLHSDNKIKIFSFPTKHNWWEPSDIDLIRISAFQLKHWYVFLAPTGKVLLPRPGCSNGQLNWDDVKPVIEPILDSPNFIICNL